MSYQRDPTGLLQAIHLIITRDPALLEIVTLSLQVSGTALFFSTLIGIPLGAALGLSRFTGRRLVIALLESPVPLKTELANTFIDWLVALPTQEEIGQFGVDKFGSPLFTPDSVAWREAHHTAPICVITLQKI